MKTFVRAGAAILAALAAPVLAEDYRAEVDAFFDRVEEGDQDAEQFGLRGTYYFGEVGTDDVPLSEAAFLGRDSRMSLGARRSNTADHYDTLLLETEVYIPTRLPLYLSATAARYDSARFDVGTGQWKSAHDTTWQAALGVTPFDGLRVSTNFYQHADYDPNLDVKYVAKLPNDHWFGAILHLADPDEGEFSWGAGADYFFDDTLKVGATWADGYEQWTLGVEKFFTRRATAGFLYFENPLWSGFELKGAWRF